MALHWTIDKIKNYLEVCWKTAQENNPAYQYKNGDRILNPLTEGLIWATIAVELGEITEKNVDEWLFRLACLEVVDASPFRVPPSREDVLSHVGLRTNVINRSRAYFLKKISIIVADRASSAVRRRAEKAAEEKVG